ncbi:hypothetical protein [Streptomonospora wellingtoniae]|uniref:Uncharacterized protein n=1 Tax=Streptomonospora wellingtoniae TaxID=3075544 RepID=A0ABU2KRG9_9ACTN|nr:hypothetical protein [Streptomonospora sp. DSM 45055]MDT0301872.1 hypothetical protein [Streptomonospora sp. DSM 45055]
MSVSEQADPVWARVPMSLTAAVPVGTCPEVLAGLLADTVTTVERISTGEVYPGRVEVLLPPAHARSDLAGPARRRGAGRCGAVTVLLWCWAERRWNEAEAPTVLIDFHRAVAAALAGAWPDAPAWSPLVLPADPVLLDAAARTGVLVRSRNRTPAFSDPPQ